MKNNLPFDEFIKSQLSNYESEVPDKIWNNIVDIRRKSRPKAFWIISPGEAKMIIAISILLVGTGAFFFFNYSAIHHNIAQHPAKQEIKNVGKNPSNPELQNSKTDIQKISTIINETSKSKATNPNAPLVRIENGVLSQNGIRSNDDHHEAPRNDLFMKYESNNESSAERLPIAKRNADTRAKISLPITQSILYQESAADKVTTQTFNANLLVSNYTAIDNARRLNGTNVITNKSTNFPTCPSLEKNAAGNKKYWEVYAGPDQVFNDYKNFGDTSSYNYLQRRKASTQFTSAFSAGIRFTRVFENGMAVRSGLNYSQINEKFNYTNPNELKFVTVITKRVVVRSPGDTLYFSDTLQYQQSVTHVKTTYNHYRNIDIPISIGYELGNGKIHANINAGVIINIYSWYKGDVLDTSYQPITITTGKTTSQYQYKTNIGVGFLGGFSLYYRMSDKFHLLLEPYFRYNLSPMSKENLNIQQKYHTAGVRLGVRIDLQ